MGRSSDCAGNPCALGRSRNGVAFPRRPIAAVATNPSGRPVRLWDWPLFVVGHGRHERKERQYGCDGYWAMVRLSTMIFSKKNAGKWVASKNGKVLATDVKLSKVLKKVEKEDRRAILLAFVPPYSHSLQASVRFDYQVYDGSLMPLIPVSFKYGKKQLPAILCLADTGATHTPLPL